MGCEQSTESIKKLVTAKKVPKIIDYHDTITIRNIGSSLSNATTLSPKSTSLENIKREMENEQIWETSKPGDDAPIVDATKAGINPTNEKREHQFSNIQDAEPRILESELMSMLDQYRKMEEKIRNLEMNDPLTVYYIKSSHLNDIKQTIQLHSQSIEALKQQKVYKTVREILDEIKEDKPTKEQQEDLALANKLEIKKTELEMLHQEKAVLENELQHLKNTLIGLKEAYSIQDEILVKLKLHEGSEELQKIHIQLAADETKRINVSEIYERWKAAKTFMAEAASLLSRAVSLWRNVMESEQKKSEDLDEQLELCEEVRDDLITSLQNINNAKYYTGMKLPYCSKLELTTVEKAIAYIFIDVKTDERRKHAENCYTAFLKRVVALYSWIDLTIEKVIRPELESTADKVNFTLKKIDQMRTSILKSKFQNVSKEFESLEGGVIQDHYAQTKTDQIELDAQSLQVLKELDSSQLAPILKHEEVMMQKTEEQEIEDYKKRVRDSIIGEEEATMNTFKLDQINKTAGEEDKEVKSSVKHDDKN